MAMAATAVEGVVTAAAATKKAAPTIKPARGILLGLVGSLLIVVTADVAKGKAPEASSVIGVGFAYLVIGAIAEINAPFGRALAMLVLVGVLFARGEEALVALQRTLRKRPTRKVAK